METPLFELPPSVQVQRILAGVRLQDWSTPVSTQSLPPNLPSVSFAPPTHPDFLGNLQGRALNMALKVEGPFFSYALGKTIRSYPENHKQPPPNQTKSSI